MAKLGGPIRGGGPGSGHPVNADQPGYLSFLDTPYNLNNTPIIINRATSLGPPMERRRTSPHTLIQHR